MGTAPVNGKALPIVLGVILAIPGTAGLYRAGVLVIE